MSQTDCHPRLRSLVGAVLVVLAILAGGLAGPASAGAVVPPKYDDFYTAPADLASVPTGGIIRSRSVSIQLLPGLKTSYKAYQVLYRTNNHQSAPVATAATIILPLKRPGTPAARKLVSYQTAYDGLGSNCMPSYTLQRGNAIVQSIEMVLIVGLLNKGWTIVTADYEGPEHLWLNGKMAAHGVLDGIRAAEAFAPAGLNGVQTQVGLIGYSGGGHATAWANEFSGSYAPELNIVGVTEGGVPADLGHTYKAVDGQAISGVILGVLAGLDRAYPEVQFQDRFLTNKGRSAFRIIKDKCLDDFLLTYLYARMKDYIKVPDLLAVPELKAIAEENSLGKETPRAPTLLYYAVSDELSGYREIQALGRKYCAEGTKIMFVHAVGQEHAILAATAQTRVMGYMSQRFSGAPVQSNCGAF